MSEYRFYSDWGKYAYPEPVSRPADTKQLQKEYRTESINGSYKEGGLPVIWNQQNKLVTMMTQTLQTIIFGASGSGKTRVLIAPLICLLANAHEHMVIADVKGELSGGTLAPYVMQALRTNGYRIHVLDLRTHDKDCINPLTPAYRMYCRGRKKEAMRMVHKFVRSISKMYDGTKADPFWANTAENYIFGVLSFMFEYCSDEKSVNLMTLLSYMNDTAASYLKECMESIANKTDSAMLNLASVLSEPDRTRTSTIATASSMLTKFVTDVSLAEMLSCTTCDPKELLADEQTPSAIFIVVPDETSAYNDVCSSIMNQINETLLDSAYEMGGVLKKRVNFIIDEFCNFYIADVKAAFSAHRSRNIRWYAVCQSKQQLKDKYPEDAGTILANTPLIYLLSTPETELLQDLSERAGKNTVLRNNQPIPWFSVDTLRHLRQEWTQREVYITDGINCTVQMLPDISCYGFSKYEGDLQDLVPHSVPPKVKCFTPIEMYLAVKKRKESSKW